MATREGELSMDDRKYAVLGMHGADVETVNVYKPVLDEEGVPVVDGTGEPQKELVQERNVVRVRMFVGDKMIDEDFDLPRLITIEEQVETAVLARMAEIQAQGTDPAKSEVVGEQPEQIVEEVK
jgi:hypothetical protein